MNLNSNSGGSNMAFSTPPFIHLGIDARTGKSYHICSRKTTEEDTEGLWIGTAGSYGRRWDGVPEIPLFHHGAAGSPSRSDAVYCRRPNRPDANALIHAGIYPSIGLYVGSVFGVRYTRAQVVGMLIITGGLILSLIPCIEEYVWLLYTIQRFIFVTLFCLYSIHSNEFEDREIGWNRCDLFYLLAAIPGSISMLYKERVIRDQPVDMSYLNAWVSVNQFIAGLLAAPLIFDAEWDPDPEVEATTLSAEDKEAMSLLDGEDDYGLRETTALAASSIMPKPQVVTMSITQKQTTASRLAKTKKPLSDMHQLQRAVKELQREAADQLVLEVESQATFEFLTSQIRALRSAFDTLSDVLMAEVDGLRKEMTRKLGDMDAEVVRQGEIHKATHTEVMHLKRTMEIWGLKERDWAKDNEILKASHSHNVEWMQQLQRDVMDVKDRLHEIKSDTGSRISEICEEANSLRRNWQKHVDDMLDRLQDFDTVAQRQAAEARVQAQQRADDLELMEQAISTVEKQQTQIRSGLEKQTQSMASQIDLLVKKVEITETQASNQRAALEQLRAKNALMEKEQRRRMDNIGKMFTIFADALNISPTMLAAAS
ncbi:Chloroquine-resistance transporter-like [Phytophthora cactorum]|nr:Chloroquine-resistance transporter-like [Phytophthora cactorum]